MLYKIEGQVNAVFPAEQVTDNMTKRLLWIETSDQYNKDVEFQFVNARMSELDNIQTGDFVEVTFGVGGRQHTKDGVTRLYNQLTGISVQKK